MHRSSAYQIHSMDTVHGYSAAEFFLKTHYLIGNHARNEGWFRMTCNMLLAGLSAMYYSKQSDFVWHPVYVNVKFNATVIF